MARRLHESLRPSDTAARFGGDEFSVLLENIGGYDQVVTACERLIGALTATVEIQGITVEPGQASASP